jgi:hypothetical protein
LPPEVVDLGFNAANEGLERLRLGVRRDDLDGEHRRDRDEDRDKQLS